MDGIEPNRKRITLSGIVRYFIGLVFLLFGIVHLSSMHYIAGVFFIFAAVITVKPVMDLVEKRFNVSISGAAKFFVVFCLVVIALAAVPNTPTAVNSTETIASSPTAINDAETTVEKTESTPTAPNSEDSINVVGTYYKCGSWSKEQYPLTKLFGENYVPLLPNNEKIWNAHVNKLAKLVLDLPSEDEKYTLRTGEILDLGSGYALETKQVDVDGQMVWFEFTKDGEFVDDEIIKVGDSSDNTWSINLDDIQGVNNVVVFKVHTNQIFQGAVDSIVQIDGIWLIDYANAKTLKTGDKFGKFTLKEIVSGVDASNLGSLVFESDNTQNNVQAESPEETPTEITYIDKQENTAVSEPILQSEQITEPETFELSGNGPEATSKFKLEKGLSKFTMTHDGSSNFAVWLMDGSDGQKVDLLANDIGLFDGSTAVGITSGGEYILNIEADGPWKVTVEQPRQTATQSSPLTLSGTGQKVPEMFYLETGLKRFEMKHDGSSNFAVWLMDDQGNRIELLANEIGSFDGSKAVSITNSGTYLLDVEADGNWIVSIE